MDGSASDSVSTSTSSTGTWAPEFSAARLNCGSVQAELTPATKPLVSVLMSFSPATTRVVASGNWVSQCAAVSTSVGVRTVPVQIASNSAGWPVLGSVATKKVSMATTPGKSDELAVVPPTMFGTAVGLVGAENGLPCAPRTGIRPVKRIALGGSFPPGSTLVTLCGAGLAVGPLCACATGVNMAVAPTATPTTTPTAPNRRNAAVDLAIVDTRMSPVVHPEQPGRSRTADNAPAQIPTARTTPVTPTYMPGSHTLAPRDRSDNENRTDNPWHRREQGARWSECRQRDYSAQRSGRLIRRAGSFRSTRR